MKTAAPMVPPARKKSRDVVKPPKPPETRPIPEIAKGAFQLAAQSYQRQVNDLALETLAAMGLSQKDGWRVYVEEGVAVLESPPAAAPPPGSPPSNG